MSESTIKELAIKDAIAEGLNSWNSIADDWRTSVSTGRCPAEILDKIISVEYFTSGECFGDEHRLNACSLLLSVAEAIEEFEEQLEPTYYASVDCFEQDKEALYGLRLALLELCSDC